jgi:uncharacterized protein with PIN domain
MSWQSRRVSPHLTLETEAIVTDQIFDMHERIVGRMFNEAKRKHEQGFAESGKAMNEKVRQYARVGHALIALVMCQCPARAGYGNSQNRRSSN